MDPPAQLLQWLEEGLSHARRAVEADKNQQDGSEDYQTAIGLLTKVVQEGQENNIPFGNTNEADLKMYISLYQKRLDHLKAKKNPGMAQLSNVIGGGGPGKQSRKQKRRKYSMSRMAFKEMDFVKTKQDSKGPPTDPLRKPFFLMRTLGCTTNGKGGYINNKIFVPELVWMQDSAKFTGHNVKMQCFQELTIRLKALSEKCPPINASYRDTGELSSALNQFVHHCVEIHRTLSKTFNFLPGSTTEEDTCSAEVQKDEGKLGNSAKSLFTNFLSTVGSLGEKLERIVSIPTRIPSAELQRYAKAVKDLFEASQMIDTWIDFSNRPEEATEGENHEMIGAYIHGKKHMEDKLGQISDFMYNVVVKIVARDFRRLTERYLRKTRKTFTRMYIEGETYQ